MQASINEIKRPPRIVPDMLVYQPCGRVGLVTKVTRKWCHVTWLINTHAVPTGCNYHFSHVYMRGDLTPCPVGTKLTIKQKA